jgi:hypothetical protein
LIHGTNRWDFANRIRPSKKSTHDWTIEMGAFFIEERIPITRLQARIIDYGIPVSWAGFDWWICESPKFEVWQFTTFVLAWRDVQSWEITC